MEQPEDQGCSQELGGGSREGPWEGLLEREQGGILKSGEGASMSLDFSNRSFLAWEGSLSIRIL